MTKFKIWKLFFWLVVSLAGLLLAARLSLPFALQTGANEWLEQQGIEVDISDLSIDISGGNLSIKGIKGLKQGVQVFNLDKIQVEWLWQSMADKQALVKAITLDGLTLNIDQLSDDQLIIAGLDIAKLADDAASDASQPAPDEEAAPLDWIIQLERIDLSNFDICYADHTADHLDYCSQFDSLSWDGQLKFELANLANSTIPLYGHGKLGMKNFVIQDNKLDRQLLSVAELELSDFSIDTLEKLAVDNIRLAQVTLLQRTDTLPAPQISRFESLVVDGVQLDKMNTISIDEINLVDHDLLLVTNQQGETEFGEWTGDTVADAGSDAATDSRGPEAETPEADVSSASPAFNYSIGKLIYNSSQSIQYQDHSFEPPLAFNFKNTYLEISNLDSTRPDQDSAIDYSAQYQEHAKFELSGTATPLSDSPSFDIKGSIAGLDLRDLSTLTRDSIGHSINSGQLDAKLNLVAKQNILDSKVDLVLYRFELKAHTLEDAKKIDDLFGLPVNMSLSALKDRDDSIRLSIPVTGDLENPDFKLDDIVRTAVSKAITSSIISYYTPFGLVTVAEGLFNLATKLRFEPVKFAPGEDALDETARQNLLKITKLMNQRKELHFSLCGFTNGADRLALVEKMPKSSDPHISENDATLKTSLEKLGNQRSAAVKQHLVDAEIDATRLIVCGSEHVEGKGLAGVNISM